MTCLSSLCQLICQLMLLRPARRSSWHSVSHCCILQAHQFRKTACRLAGTCQSSLVSHCQSCRSAMQAGHSKQTSTKLKQSASPLALWSRSWCHKTLPAMTALSNQLLLAQALCCLCAQHEAQRQLCS